MINRIIDKLIAANRIAVISHIRPDLDTLGSSIALGAALKSIGKTVGLFVDDILPERYNFLKLYDSYNTQEFKNFDVLVACDCSDPERMGKYGYEFSRHKNTINIDHHQTNTYFAKINFVKGYSSTCEMILEILESFQIPIELEIAVPLYCGLSTDTGNFMFSSTSERTFSSALKLIRIIKDISPYAYELYKKMSLNRTKLLGKVISSVKMHCDGKFAVLVVKQSDLQEFGVPSYDTEGFVDYAINIEGVEIGACIFESKDKVFKISLRSRKKDVSAICGYFGGGGHLYAAGCKLEGYFEDIYEKLLHAVSIGLM